MVQDWESIQKNAEKIIDFVSVLGEAQKTRLALRKEKKRTFKERKMRETRLIYDTRKLGRKEEEEEERRREKKKQNGSQKQLVGFNYLGYAAMRETPIKESLQNLQES